MLYSTNIKKGDTIGVTATSDGNIDKIKIKRLDNAIKNFEERGYTIKETPNVRSSYKGRSSSKEQRAKEFMKLVEDKNIAAIITARGGDFLLEILPYIDFEKIRKNPKWIQGFSDTTGLGFCVTTICDIATIYAENFGDFGMENWHTCLENNLKILEGKEIIQESFKEYQSMFQDYKIGLETYKLDKKVEWKNARNEEKIELNGRILGGCIDILVSLVGTKFDKVKEFIEKYKNDKIVWFFDNCELTSEGILRGLWQLKEAGWFSNTSGFIFGRTMTRSSCYGISFEEAVEEVLQELNVPIILEADIGHLPPQFTIINGAIVHIVSKDGKGKIDFTLK